MIDRAGHDSPDWDRDGVSPSQLPTRCAFSNRAQSAPSSRWIASAVSVSTPRNARNRATVGHHCGIGRELPDPLSEHLLAGGQPVHARDQIRPRQLRHRLAELLAGEPAAMLLRPSRRLGIHPAVAQQHLRDAMARVHQIPPARVMRARELPSASTCIEGTTTGCSDPAIRHRASSSASLRSVLTRRPSLSVSGPARSPRSRPPPRPPPGRARTRSARPHSTPCTGPKAS